MGSMSITKPAICNLSSALPQSSNYAFFPLKVSRIHFPSSTNYPQGTKLYSSNNADVSIGDEKKKSDSYDETLEKMGRALDETRDKAYEIKEGMKGRAEDLQVIASEMADLVADKTQEAKDAKEKMEAMHEKNMESAGTMAAKTGEAKDKAVEMGQDAMAKLEDLHEKNMENAGSMAAKTGEAKDRAVEMGQDAMAKLEDLHEKNMETAGSVVDKTKEFVQNTKETVEEAVEIVEGAWDAPLATTQKINDSVEGKSDDS